MPPTLWSSAPKSTRRTSTPASDSVPLTNRTGDYVFPLLVPGTYTVKVEHPGFKTYTRSGIVVRVNDQVAINVALEVGQANQTVEVKAESPLLDTSSASMGQVIESRTINELPLKDGMVVTMATLSPGVIFTPESAGYVRPFDTSSPSTMSIDGTRSGSNQFMMDGAPNMQGTQIAYSPPPGVVEEFKVQSATFDASSGFMGGASHQHEPEIGRQHAPRPDLLLHAEPGVHGRQVFPPRRRQTAVPAVSLGRQHERPRRSFRSCTTASNRTFFMYGYEGIWSFDPVSLGGRGRADRRHAHGRFLQPARSRIALSDLRSVFDPARGQRAVQPPAAAEQHHSRRAGSTRRPRRSPPCGTLRTRPARWTARTITPRARTRRTPTGTTSSASITTSRRSSASMSARTSRTCSGPRTSGITSLSATTSSATTRASAFDDVYTISPRFFVNARYTLTRFITGNDTYQEDFDLAGLGFSPTYVNQINGVDPRYYKLPNINVTGYSSLGGVSPQQQRRHRHSRGGGELHLDAGRARPAVRVRLSRLPPQQFQSREFGRDRSTSTPPGPAARSTTLRPRRWARASRSSSTAFPGQRQSFTINDSYADQSKVPALFLQDDWKISRKFTLSLGLRYERPTPVTERYNRSVRGFDASVASPIQAQALANYARNPDPGAAGQPVQGMGGLTFAGVNGQPRELWKSNQNLIMPRIGFAYSHHAEDRAARRLRHLLRRARRGQREREPDRLHAVHGPGAHPSTTA